MYDSCFIQLWFNLNNLNNLGIKPATLSTKTIRNLLNTKSHQHIKSNACVYSNPYNNCKMKYIDKTARNLKKRDIRQF